MFELMRDVVTELAPRMQIVVCTTRTCLRPGLGRGRERTTSATRVKLIPTEWLDH